MDTKPTDKKLTFVEWFAKTKCEDDIKYAKRAIKNWSYHLINGEIHSGYCTNEHHLCKLCELKQWLSEYHKYFKLK